MLLGLALLTCWGASARAELDPERDKPYELQVILKVAEHRLLTDVFIDRIRNELRDSLRAALGNLAHVEVITSHPRLEDIRVKGLQGALDGWNFLTESKMHFVLLSFTNGGYDIQARQYDGFTGLPSAVVRHGFTDDRLLVARTMALLINQDMGPTGTVTHLEGDKVNLVMKASGLGLPLSPWLKKGDVFAIAQIQETGTGRRSLREPGALLQVTDEPSDGVYPCQLWHRYRDPLQSGPGVKGYRCLKLGTTRAHLRLRLLAEGKLATPLSARQVQISADSFDGAALERQATDPDGLVTFKEAYNNIAFVKVFDGSTPLAQVPVEILDERTVTIKVTVDPEIEKRGQLYWQRDRWLRRILDTIDVVATLIKTLNDTQLTSEAALKKARDGYRSLVADIAYLIEEETNLKNEAARLDAKDQLDLSQGEQRLQDLQNQRRDLEEYITKLEEIIRDENDPKKKQWKEMVLQARLLQKSFDYDRAIDLYKKVLEQTNDATVREELDKLTRAWAVSGPEHQKAREFIYNVWPRIEKASELNTKMARVREAFDTCRSAGDILTPNMLLKANLAHGTRLSKLGETLKPEKEDDRRELETIQAVIKELTSLSKDVEKFQKEARANH
jgi:tetratricopeptide (TPR) repeat protein